MRTVAAQPAAQKYFCYATFTVIKVPTLLLKKLMRDVAVTDIHHTKMTVMKSKKIDSLEKMRHSKCKGWRC